MPSDTAMVRWNSPAFLDFFSKDEHQLGEVINGFLRLGCRVFPGKASISGGQPPQFYHLNMRTLGIGSQTLVVGSVDAFADPIAILSEYLVQPRNCIWCTLGRITIRNLYRDREALLSGQPVNPLFFNIFLFALESSRKQSAESKTVPPRSELRSTPGSFDGASCPSRGIYRLPDYIYYGHFLCLAGENEETTSERLLVLIASILQPTQF